MSNNEQCEKRNSRLGHRAVGRLILLILLLSPFAVGGEFAACSTLGQFANALTTTIRRDSTEVFTTCGTCPDARGGRDYFDIPTAPEHPFIVTFEVRAIGGDGVVDTTDVQAFLVLKNCGSEGINQAFEVKFTEQGLELVGRISHTPNECIVLGQRTPAYWEVIINRTSNVSISVEWEISWVDYSPSAQPLLPGDLTG